MNYSWKQLLKIALIFYCAIGLALAAGAAYYRYSSGINHPTTGQFSKQ